METIGSSVLMLATAFSIVGGSKFALYSKIKVSWFEVEDLCKLKNRASARVETESDQAWVEKLAPIFFWIGLKGNVNANQFIWTDSSVGNYTNWAEGFPGRREGLDCVRMRYFDFKWETFNCSKKLNYLCQDQYLRKSYVVTTDIKLKGLFLGFGVIGGLLLLCCLVLQLPCCRVDKADRISNLGVGKRRQTKRQSK